jgi:hypothetical protein
MMNDSLVWSLALALLTPIAPAIAGTVTVTGPKGTTTSTANATQQGNSRTVNRATTGPNGNTTSVDSTYTWENNQLEIERKYSWPGGQTSGSQSTYQGDGQGNYTGTVNTTNRRGQTNTYNVQGQRQRTGNAWSNQGTVTGPQGQQTGFQRQGSCANGQCSGQRAVNFGDGSQRQGTGEGQRTAPGTWEGSGQVTNRQGQTQNRTWRRSPQ